MRERAIQAQADAKQEIDAYIRETRRPSSPVDELHKLHDLKEKGAISDEEYEKMKAKLLA